MIEKLTRGTAELNSDRLVALANLIPEVEYSADNLLATAKPDGRDMSSKWEYSYLMKEGEVIVGFIVGYVRAAEANDQYPRQSLYMSELAVDTSHRGKGYAKQLVTHYLEKALEAGVTDFTLQTNAADWNEPVRGLYERFGFREDG